MTHSLMSNFCRAVWNKKSCFSSSKGLSAKVLPSLLTLNTSCLDGSSLTQTLFFNICFNHFSINRQTLIRFRWRSGTYKTYIINLVQGKLVIGMVSLIFTERHSPFPTLFWMSLCSSNHWITFHQMSYG